MEQRDSGATAMIVERSDQGHLCVRVDQIPFSIQSEDKKSEMTERRHSVKCNEKNDMQQEPLLSLIHLEWCRRGRRTGIAM